MTKTTDTAMPALLLGEAGSDPIEDRLRETVRATIEALFDEELAAFLGRIRYGRGGGARKGYRHGRRERELVGTFGAETVSVPRARIEGEDGKTTEWRSKALPRYQRLTRRAEALIAAVYLAGTNTRRVKRALFGLFQGAVGKDVVSRAWRKVKVDWDAWCARSLAEEDIVRLILDGTVIRTRLDRRATNISVLAAIGVRRDGQKILLSIRHMGGESTAAWRRSGGFRGRTAATVHPHLDDLDARGLKRPDFVIVDGAPGLEAALIALWGAELPIQRCTVHKHRNLLAHAPKTMHDELTEDYRDMIHADTAAEVETRRKAFLRKWRLKCRAVADSIEGEGGTVAPVGPRKPPERRAAVRLHPPRSVAMEIGAHHQCHRAPQRGIPTPRQDPDRPALRRDRAHAALGAPRLRADLHAQGRRMGDPVPTCRALRP